MHLSLLLNEGLSVHVPIGSHRLEQVLLLAKLALVDDDLCLVLRDLQLPRRNLLERTSLLYQPPLEVGLVRSLVPLEFLEYLGKSTYGDEVTLVLVLDVFERGVLDFQGGFFGLDGVDLCRVVLRQNLPLAHAGVHGLGVGVELELDSRNSFREQLHLGLGGGLLVLL